MDLNDVYVFFEEVNECHIDVFFKVYLPNFTSMEDYFEYPKYEMPVVFESDNYKEMLDYVIKNNGDYTFYFENDGQHNLKYKQAIIRINKDRSMLLGLSVISGYEQTIIDSYEKEFNTTDIFITYNVPPLTSKDEVLKYLPRSH